MEVEKLFDGMATLPTRPSIILANLLSSQEKAVSKVLSIYAIKRTFNNITIFSCTMTFILPHFGTNFYNSNLDICFPGRRALAMSFVRLTCMYTNQ